MKRIGIYLVLGAILLMSCKEQPQKTKWDNAFAKTKELAHHRESELFDVFDTDMSDEERAYLKYLFAYMPLSDLADYEGQFYLDHVRSSLQARAEMPWAEQVTEENFLHYVLPHRVNNENLDASREVFYQLLKHRVDGLSMTEAALEINHWCHEKVEYRPADGRTSSPLATMKTAFGRCGEESTFAVAALRAMSIPARQVYTPRWAHSDDNHAWVEVWTDGQWHFMGACEPEPVLDLGWFNESASRAMLIHARSFGKGAEDEEVNVSNSQYDDVNVVTRYAHTFRQYIQVVDEKQNPVKGAKVEYQLYNYAEFYPITTKKTDGQGLSFLTTGIGELLVWCSDANRYGYKRVKIGEQDTVKIELNNPKMQDMKWELRPPAASDKLKVNLTEEERNENKKILQHEDQIRGAYVEGFVTEFNDVELQNNFGHFLKKSRGNYQEIMDFVAENRNSPWASRMLEVIAEKDLRDVEAATLTDHLANTIQYADAYAEDIFVPYILNPRIALEVLKPYRVCFLEAFHHAEDIYNTDPQQIVAWVAKTIMVKDERQAYSLPISPVGVYQLRVADRHSRDIFFVALCRSLGVPARLEPGTKLPQYYREKQWIDVFFDGEPVPYERVQVRFEVLNHDLKFTPQYYHHFTLARFYDNRYNTLALGEYQNLDEIKELNLIKGKYQLLTSNRLSSGLIMVDLKYFDLEKDTIIGMEFPERESVKEVYGTLDRKAITQLIDFKDERAKMQQEETNLVVIFIEPDKEPSKHVLNDLQHIRSDFESLNNSILFLIGEKDVSAAFKSTDYPELPYRSHFRTVTNPANEIKLDLKGYDGAKPLVMVVEPDGEIIYYSEGYRVGLSNDILKML